MDSLLDDDGHRVCIDFLFPVFKSTIKKKKYPLKKHERNPCFITEHRLSESSSHRMNGTRNTSTPRGIKQTAKASQG